MGRARQMLRSGAWATRERVRLIALAILAASTVGLLYLVITAHAGIDFRGRPLGTDFSDIYAAGSQVLDGHPDAPFDPALQYRREQSIFGPATPFYGWHYPPFFLFVAESLARLPYGLALTLWQALTFVLYLLAIRTILCSSLRESHVTGRQPTRRADACDARPTAAPEGWLLLSIAFPAVLINVGHGQNGFLTAALLGAALVVLDSRPVVAGILFGLLAYKPQFGLMIPIVLVASGRWRTFAAAAATVALLAAATALAFGPHVWQAFLQSTRFTRVVALEHGETGWYKIQSIFSWARMWGASVPLAYALQAIMTAAIAAALGSLWRSAAAYPLKAAALCLAALLATPYSFDYDMMVLAPALAFLAAEGLLRGFLPWEKTAFFLLWAVPLIARSLPHATLVPIGVPMMLTAFVLVLRRATSDIGWPAAFLGRSAATNADGGGAARGHDIAAFEP